MRHILPLSSGDFASLQRLLSETYGLRFEEDRCQTLHLALWRRLQKRGYQSYQEYYHFLKYHPEGPLEIRDLVDLITIQETHFFRNKAQFDVLIQFVLPEIIARKKRSEDRSIRCWSAGCSTGDEAYSIAIAMLEALPSCQEWSLSIFGSDINRNGLAWARRGIYSEKNISNLPKEYLNRYFKVQGSSYLLHPEIKEMVQFEYHNLAKGPFADERMINIDILFCRNVIIYLDVETTRHIIEHFYHCVAPEGYLFLGHAETLWQISNRFEGIEFPYTFIYKKLINPVQKEGVKPLMVLPEIRLAKLAPAAKPTLPPSLTMATLLANEAKYKEAADILTKIIAEDSLSVEAYYFLGVLSYKTGDLKEAEAQFRKVIYIDPNSALAYFNLGNIYLYQGRIREATREFRNVIRILEKGPKDEQIRFCEDFTADFLLKACGKMLMEISKGGK
jgi:chemotaxis protein methyltransferase CheR